MIAPLIPYRIAGVAWYQGEANAIRHEFAMNYDNVLPALIKDWRTNWGEGDFPFLIVQLAAFDSKPDHDWPTLREAQTKALSVDNTALIVTLDVGERDNIHPRKKKPVGERLSLAARALVYGEEVPSSGPVYSGMDIREGSAVIKFKHVYDGLIAKGGELKGFVIAGEDKKFVSAEAKIDGDMVVVLSSDVKAPIAVRYAWKDFPECNLFNKAGLPAGPFRTDCFIATKNSEGEK
ncbi:sialate O-acetylesterase [Candidatus Hydrogenedentota bacterium]